MDYLLVKTSHDWADEFDAVSVFCMQKQEYEEKLAKIKAGFENGNINEDHEHYFGTNEALQFSSFEDFLNGVETIEVSKEFADTFGDHVGVSVFAQLLEQSYGEDEEDDDYEEDEE